MAFSKVNRSVKTYLGDDPSFSVKMRFIRDRYSTKKGLAAMKRTLAERYTRPGLRKMIHISNHSIRMQATILCANA